MIFKVLLNFMVLILAIVLLVGAQDEQENEILVQSLQKEAFSMEQSNKKVAVYVHSDCKDAMRSELEKVQNKFDEALKNLSRSLAEIKSNQEKLLQNFKLDTKPSTEQNFQVPISTENETLFDRNLNCLKNCDHGPDLPQDCAEAFLDSHQKSGIYVLKEDPRGRKAYGAYCQRHADKFWIIIHRRQDGAVEFYRNWTEYKNGFGDLNGEYWLGLDRLHSLTSTGKKYDLWIQMETFEGEISYVRYSPFSVASENDGYKLTVGTFSGMGVDRLNYNNGKKFSTFDVDNDQWANNCASEYQGAWWYNACTLLNLNGLYKEKKYVKAIYYDSSNIKPLKYVHMALHPTSSV